MKLANGKEGKSDVPTPWATICLAGRDFGDLGVKGCGRVYMTEEAYNFQMERPDATWRCANCGYEAQWDDDTFEKWLDEQEKQ